MRCGGSGSASRGARAHCAATDAAIARSTRSGSRGSPRVSGATKRSMPSVAPKESWKPTSATFDGCSASSTSAARPSRLQASASTSSARPSITAEAISAARAIGTSPPTNTA